MDNEHVLLSVDALNQFMRSAFSLLTSLLQAALFAQDSSDKSNMAVARV